ncbi:MAG: elongation factor 1-beta [Nanoarchaeota archaeon]|nr:elongation factor 1-beta [Nanoarchaeota archaeon]
MANVIATIKIMPESPEIDLDSIEESAKKLIAEFAGEGETKTEQEPIAFGLKALKITFVMDEAKGSPDPLADKIKGIEGVNSAEVVDVRRAIG